MPFYQVTLTILHSENMVQTYFLACKDFLMPLTGTLILEVHNQYRLHLLNQLDGDRSGEVCFTESKEKKLGGGESKTGNMQKLIAFLT